MMKLLPLLLALLWLLRGSNSIKQSKGVSTVDRLNRSFENMMSAMTRQTAHVPLLSSMAVIMALQLLALVWPLWLLRMMKRPSSTEASEMPWLWQLPQP